MIATMSAQNANSSAYVTIEPPPFLGRFPSAVVESLPGLAAKLILTHLVEMCKMPCFEVLCIRLMQGAF